jgi:hypothetical protein
VADIILIVALFVVLRPISQGLALLAASWRVIETSILFPDLAKIVLPAYWAPLGFFEVTMGFLLLIRGIGSPGVAGPAGRAEVAAI